MTTQIVRDGNVPFLVDISMALPYKGSTFPTREIECAVFNTVKRMAVKAENQIGASRWCCKLNGEPIDAADVAAVKKSHHYHPPTLTYDYLYYFAGSAYNESCGIVI
jgi:hypothetical protein